jgi:TonB family protein
MPLPAKAQVNVRFDLPSTPAAAPVVKTPPATLPNRQLVPAQGVLKAIDFTALPEELRAQLQPLLTPFQGQQFGNDLMGKIQREINGVDKHIVSQWGRVQDPSTGDPVFNLRLMLPSESRFAVGGGIVGELHSGIIGGVVGANSNVMPPPPPPPPPTSDGSTPRRIRVGGNVQQMMLIQQPRPVYPPLAKQARIQGVVRFNAIIATDGTVATLTVESGHPLLVDAAVESVKQWVYKPTLLNGEPVEVVTVIDVNFTLSQ